MLTYDLTKTDGPLYKCLYECIKNDISQGKLSSGEKMPSNVPSPRIWGLVPLRLKMHMTS